MEFQTRTLQTSRGLVVYRHNMQRNGAGEVQVEWDSHGYLHPSGGGDRRPLNDEDLRAMLRGRR